MHYELETLADAAAVAAAGAASVAERAHQILWLITGSDKKGPLAKLLAGDTTIPAGRVEATASLVLADRAAT